MSNLISSNLHRLFLKKTFLLCVGALFSIALLLILNDCKVDARQHFDGNLEDYYFRLLPFFGLLLALFISLYIGTDYSDGTIRNKLIIGHTRTHLFFANLFTCWIGGIIFFSAWALGGLAGIFYFGPCSIGVWNYIVLMVISLFTILSLSTIFCIISQLCSNRSLSIIICIVVSVLLILFSSIFYNRLCEPKTISNSVMDFSTGQIIEGEEHLNPLYIGGVTRIIYQAMTYILPPGQQIRVEELLVEQPIIMLICSILVTALVILVGLRMFRKKDLQ